MCGILASTIRRARLYNPKHRSKVGFFQLKQKQRSLTRLTDERHLKWREMNLGLQHFAHQISNLKEKNDDLALTISKIFAEQHKQKVCIYASKRNTKSITQAISSIQKFPERKPEQVLMLKRFRKGDFAILLSDGISGKLPTADVVIHYDLPKTPQDLFRRIRPQRANIFFHLYQERVYIACLQNVLKTVLDKWEVPAKKQHIQSFLQRFGDTIGNMLPINLNFQLSSNAQQKHEILAAFMYFIYRKIMQTKKHYLLYDPAFKTFKTRKDVERFLEDNGITNYNGITLTKKGFVVDSYDMLTLPMTHETAFEHPQIRQIRKRINAGYISSYRRKQRAFNILARHHERHMIRTFRINRNSPLERHHTRSQTAS